MVFTGTTHRELSATGLPVSECRQYRLLSSSLSLDALWVLYPTEQWPVKRRCSHMSINHRGISHPSFTGRIRLTPAHRAGQASNARRAHLNPMTCSQPTLALWHPAICLQPREYAFELFILRVDLKICPCRSGFSARRPGPAPFYHSYSSHVHIPDFRLNPTFLRPLMWRRNQVQSLSRMAPRQLLLSGQRSRSASFPQGHCKETPAHRRALWGVLDLNQRPSACQADTLAT